MANLRELRNKLNTVKSTRKLTSAMKLVAGVKLRKAEAKALATRGYSNGLLEVVSSIRQDFLEHKPEIMIGRSIINSVLIIVMFSDRGLCGNFNYNIGRQFVVFF